MRLFSFGVLLLASSSSAQTRQAPRPAWVSLNGGVAGSPVDYPRAGPALLGMSLQYQRALGAGPLLAQAGVAIGVEVLGSRSLTEAHVAVGAYRSAGPLLLAATAGPSVARITKSSFDDPRYANGQARTVPGAFVGVQAVVAVFPAVGVGVEAFGHLNADLPVGGVGVSFSVGRLRGALAPSLPGSRQPWH